MALNLVHNGPTQIWRAKAADIDRPGHYYGAPSRSLWLVIPRGEFKYLDGRPQFDEDRVRTRAMVALSLTDAWEWVGELYAFRQAVWSLARHGFKERAQKVVRRLLERRVTDHGGSFTIDDWREG